MRKVATVVEVESHKSVTGFEAGEKDGRVGLRSGVRLHVGIGGTKKTADAVDGHLLHLVHHLTTTVVTLAGIAFGIFVGQDGTHGAHHLVADKVFAGDEFDAAHLALLLGIDKSKDFFFHKI